MTAGAIIDLCSLWIVVIGVALASTASIGRPIWLVALQSAFGAMAAIGVGLAVGSVQLIVAGLVALGAKAVLYPLVLRRILRASSVTVERHPYVGRRVSLITAIAIIFAAAAATSDIGSTGAVDGARGLPSAIAAVLTGLFLMMSRRKVLSMLIGLLVFENGLALAAFALTRGMPMVVELGVLFDLLIAVLVGWVYARRMVRVFGSLSTDHLRSLRG